MKLPKLKIGKLEPQFPLIQGGMAIRVSTGHLAGAVAAAGGIGIIGASGMRFDELSEEIEIARYYAHGGIVGINIMFAAREFLGIVKTALESEIDVIFTGAGFSRDVFRLGKEANTPIVSIISSARLAKMAEQLGASAVVVEGGEAGGHLGTDRSVKEILPEVLTSVQIPVIGAGGLWNGHEAAKLYVLGARGVQMASRFVISNECNAQRPFKELYLHTNGPSDFVKFPSVVGFPGQAIRTGFVLKVLNREAPPPAHCDKCLKSCTYEYCIYDALEAARKGDIDNGIVFSGKNVWRMKKKIQPARDIVAEIVDEAEEAPELGLKKELEDDLKLIELERKEKPVSRDRSTRLYNPFAVGRAARTIYRKEFEDQ